MRRVRGCCIIYVSMSEIYACSCLMVFNRDAFLLWTVKCFGLMDPGKVQYKCVTSSSSSSSS